jgi:hypothetical protein
MSEEQHDWKFAQCFGDKGDSDDITDGNKVYTYTPKINRLNNIVCS